MSFTFGCKLRYCLLNLLCAAILLGCESGPKTELVTGMVVLDGEPLDDATIEFDPGEGRAPASLDVANGKFAGEVVVGPKTVRFSVMRPSKPNPALGPGDVQNPIENILPDSYGYESTIKLNVGSDKSTDLIYELKSK